MENSNSNKKERNTTRNKAKPTNHTKPNQPTELTQKHMLQNSFCNFLFKIIGDFQALSGLDW